MKQKPLPPNYVPIRVDSFDELLEDGGKPLGISFIKRGVHLVKHNKRRRIVGNDGT